MNAMVTVAIPTRNRPVLLGASIDSVLRQSCRDMDVVVLDNASSAGTQELVTRYMPRVRYSRVESDIGIIENWNRAINECRTPYLAIFHDDDVMEPRFLERSLEILEAHPAAGFSFAEAIKVSADLSPLGPWGIRPFERCCMSGETYIVDAVVEGCCRTLAPTVVARHAAYLDVGLFRDSLCFNSFDFNMWIRMATRWDVCALGEPLILHRIHAAQMSEVYWRTMDKAKGRLATMLELQQAVALLLSRESVSANELLRSTLVARLSDITVMAAGYARRLTADL